MANFRFFNGGGKTNVKEFSFLFLWALYKTYKKMEKNVQINQFVALR